MNKITFDSIYASKWGATDFYPEVESKLREVIESGEDFETELLDCKKEIESVKYTRAGNEFKIEVNASMDGLYDEYDLIYDALWKIGKPDYELTDNDIDNIIDAAINSLIDDHTYLARTIGLNSYGITFDQVVSETNTLIDRANQNNNNMFDLLCQIVKEYIEYIKEG